MMQTAKVSWSQAASLSADKAAMQPVALHACHMPAHYTCTTFERVMHSLAISLSWVACYAGNRPHQAAGQQPGGVRPVHAPAPGIHPAHHAPAPERIQAGSPRQPQLCCVSPRPQPSQEHPNSLLTGCRRAESFLEEGLDCCPRMPVMHKSDHS